MTLQVTPAQLEMLGFLMEFDAKNGRSPSHAEIRKGMGYRLNTSFRAILVSLHKKKLITLPPTQPPPPVRRIRINRDAIQAATFTPKAVTA